MDVCALREHPVACTEDGIKLGTPLKTLADVIHPFPAFNRILGESLNQLAAAVAGKGEHHEQYAGQH